MQRYRINYRLFAGLFVGSIVLAVAAYFFWSWQVDRNANWFRDRSKVAQENNDLHEAFEYLHKYVMLRQDELVERVQLAHIASDLAVSEDATREERGVAYRVLEDTVRRSDDDELRRKLADLQILFGRPQDAIVHIDQLLETYPDDSELLALRVKSLFSAKAFRRATVLALGLVGYDKKNDQFDIEKSKARDQPEVYGLLAGLLYSRDKDKELARRVIDQMVAANPESYTAYLQQSIFLSGIGEKEEAAVALEKAFELAPTDASVLHRKGIFALEDKNYDEAYQFFSAGIDKYPEKLLFYSLLARVELRRKEYGKAIAILDRGIQRFGVKRAVNMIIFKIDILFMKNDRSGVEHEIETLAKLNSPYFNPLVEFENARLKVEQRQWAEAAKQLARVRPLLFDFAQAQAFAGAMLARCYEQLGQLDLALQSYDLVLSDFPTLPNAVAGRKRVWQRLHPDDVEQSPNLDKIINETLAQPESLQDWDQVEQFISKVAEQNNLPETRVQILRAHVLAQRKMFPEAKQLLQKAAATNPDDVTIGFAAVRLRAMEPDKGPTIALKLLDKIVKKWGDSLSSRILRADLLVAIADENLSQQLQSLTEGIDAWTEGEQVQLWMTLGMKYQQLDMPEESRQCWVKAAELVPSNLPVLMHLFDLALRQGDDAGMRDAQGKILELVRNEKDSSYILTEVKRRIIGFGQKTVSREELAQARDLLDEALRQRPQWHELHVVYGQLILLLEGDLSLALQRFDDALKYGPPNLNAVALQVRLLAGHKLYQEARDKMDLLPEEMRHKVLGRIEPLVLLNTGDPEAAFESGEKIVAQRPNDPATQVWFAQLANQMGKLEAVEAAFRKATELNPSEPEYWTQLIAVCVQQKKNEDIEIALRAARLALDAEYLPLLTAKLYELQGRWQDAERIYLSAFANRLDEVAIARRMATFYLLWVKKNPANREKAAPYINRILRESNEGRVDMHNEHVVWARRRVARMLAASGDYRQSLKAQRLLNQGAVDGQLGAEDQALLADILSKRNEPESQLQAIQLLESLFQNRRLKKEGVLLLAQLLNKTGEWQRCEALMLDAIGNFGSDSEVWSNYITMLIAQDEYTKAADRITRFEDLGPKNNVLAIRLRAQLAAETGDQTRLRKLLQSLLPKKNLNTALDAKQLDAIVAVARMATQFKDYEFAEKLYRLYVRRLPEKVFELTQFLAMHGNCDEALQLIKRQLDGQTDAVVQLSVQMLRHRRPEIGDRYDEEVNRILAIALRQDPDSMTRQLMRAEALEIQEDFESSREAYEKLLARDDMPPRLRAAALNNLGFQLALQNLRLDEAAQLVNQAIEILGPIADLLDTRAVVRIARKEFDLAIEDMTLALKVNPNAMKYFHLAKAHLLAGNNQAALAAWAQALKMGLELKMLSKIEQPSFQQMEEQIKSLRSET